MKTFTGYNFWTIYDRKNDSYTVCNGICDLIDKLKNRFLFNQDILEYVLFSNSADFDFGRFEIYINKI